MAEQITILIVDDHKMVREGLKAFIAPIPYLKVVGEARDGREAVELVAHLKPDVILLDLVMPTMDGIEAARLICQRDPQARILMVTSFTEAERVMAAIQAGALGYLLKDSSPQELEEAIQVVFRGESYLPPSIALKVIQQLKTIPPSRSEEPVHVLTIREIDILKRIAKGDSNDEIARDLYISISTVRSHLGRIMKKLQVENRTQAALYALRTGIISLDDPD